MSKYLIIYEKSPFNFLIFYKRFKKIFVEENYHNTIIKNKNYIKVDQFFNAIRSKEADYNISKHVQKICNKAINLNQKKLNDKDLDKSYNTFKQKIALYVCDINRAFAFAKLIKQKYKIKNKVLIETNIFNYKVYKIMKDLNLLDKTIDIAPEVKNISKIYYYLKNIFFFFKILIFPELNFFRNNFLKKKEMKIKKLLSIKLKDLRFDKNNLNLRFLDDKKLKDQIIYINEDKDITSSRDYIKYKKNIVSFNKDLFKKFNFLYYLRYIYLDFFLKRIKFIKLGITHPMFFNVLFKTLRELMYWKLFYTIYETKFHINSMTDEKVFVKDFHNRNNVKTIFLYFSSTEELIKRNFNKSFTRVNYVFLNYDFLVSDKISISLFKNQQTKVNKFIKIGSLGSQIILNNTNKRDIQKNKRKINIFNTNKIISFFDHTIGFDGVWSQKEYNIFLQKIHELLIIKSNYEIVYKSKKIKDDLLKKLTKKNKILFNKILKFKNFTYLEGNNKKLSAYQIISISHLVVSAPVSSIITEALNANKKILVFDPEKKYKTKNFFITNFSELYCNDKNNFIDKLKNLDKMSNYKISKKILNNFVSKILGFRQFGINSQNLLKVLKDEL